MSQRLESGRPFGTCDSVAYTVMAVPTPRRVACRVDSCEYVKGSNGKYTNYGPGDGPWVIFTKRSDGKWRQEGTEKGSPEMTFGERRTYRDPSF